MTKEKWFLACMSNASIKCRSLTREKKNWRGDTYTSHKHRDKNHSNMNNKKKKKWNKTKWITLIILKTIMMTIITIK